MTTQDTKIEELEHEDFLINDGAPSCGLYIIISDVDDHDLQRFRLNQALHAANRFSSYNLNRHIVEYRPLNGNPLPDTEVLASYRETCTANGFIFLLQDNPEIAAKISADGVICTSLQLATSARKFLDENAIIGLRCTSRSEVDSALAHELDFISLYSSPKGDSLMDLLHLWTNSTENPISVEGAFNQENCEAFIKAGATFIDSSFHIWTHPSGNAMQGVVNMLDAFEHHKTIIATLN